MRRIFRKLVEFRWLILRVVLWLGGTALSAARGQWVLAAVIFVVLGGFFFIWGTALFLIWRRQRRRARGN
jgi:membrane-bound metal-dependent hydrolase YbcI (DUF457 family)